MEHDNRGEGLPVGPPKPTRPVPDPVGAPAEVRRGTCLPGLSRIPIGFSFVSVVSVTIQTVRNVPHMQVKGGKEVRKAKPNRLLL